MDLPLLVEPIFHRRRQQQRAFDWPLLSFGGTARIERLVFSTLCGFVSCSGNSTRKDFGRTMSKGSKKARW